MGLRIKALAFSHVFTCIATCTCCFVLLETNPRTLVERAKQIVLHTNHARVCTYYTQAFGNSRQADDFEQLVALWRQSWTSQGWTPTVLTQADAEPHPRYGELLHAFSHLPTVNAPAYELSCYLRWVAALQAGCGWLVDIDVMNYGFPPQAPYAGPLVHIFDGHVPAVVTGAPAAFEAVIGAFEHSYGRFENGTPDASIQQIHGRPHTSDMYIIKSRPDLYVPLGYPMSLSSPWARNASVLLHFSAHDVRTSLKLTKKAQAVREMRPFPAAAGIRRQT